ncbi:DISARM system helicase DrmA [Nocardiopsis potens]|uniref:DISARM system helicase DrmA n=1 Tax=Nocardiopsis potens TaxID=1246458 RepID=UPI00034D9E1A|nr:DISARM system helicase DrmA [Nocardiopsis potens]
MGDEKVLQPPAPREIRDELERLVVQDLYGPVGGDEHERVSGERVTDRYILGRLAPNGALTRPDEQDGFAEAGLEDSAGIADAEPGDSVAEPEAPAVPTMYCNAYGFTVCVSPETGVLRARATWARYVRAKSSDGPQPLVRDPRAGEALIPLTEGAFGPIGLDPEQPGVALRGRVREHQGMRLATVFLVNGQRGETRDQEKWLFQAELEVTAEDGTAPVFLPRPDGFSGGDAFDRDEQKRLAMTYRFDAEFAVGHSTAVSVRTAPADRLRAVSVRTDAVPGYELPHTDVPSAEADPDLPELADTVLDMARLGAEGADAIGVRAAVGPLVDGYRAWIGRQRDRISDPAARLNGGTDYRAEAEENLRRAEGAADRIAAAIDLLESDPKALAAFRFANRAMHLQRVRSIAAKVQDGRSADERTAACDVPANRSWRPFQLAFILLNLPSVTDPAHPERSRDKHRVADLLWFPTGGGKTEAYLGLTAYTLAIRRLQSGESRLRSDSGVAVLMRYTLRLLTIQQFQRATTLICACEALRTEDEQTWGRVPFRIGLWVGTKVTPNDYDRSQDWVKAKRADRSVNRADGSPHQLTSCPWCGAGIDPKSDIEVDSVERRTRVLCPDFECRFSSFGSGGDGIPVLLVDEEIYRLVPSLLIATVDKFAQLAWKGETRALFGRVGQVCGRHGFLTGDMQQKVCGGAKRHQAAGKGASAHPEAQVTRAAELRPPDLIVQDELHLISGPLGSLVGLYETAVDRLATWEYTDPAGRVKQSGVRPKVIASTATVRRAAHQIGSLFAGRSTEVFPPPGLDADDSFFARRRPVERRDGRRYLGICAHGVRVKSAQIRVYVAVMAAAQRLHDKYGGNEVTDPYMTLVGYFNSLRDLGGMRRLVDDDVATRLARADGRGLARRRPPWVEELTSRLGTDAVPAILDRLEVPFTAGGAKAPRPLDVLLATNMVAVGVDVPRLGAMVVNGQPKSAAEYIQATSRVGRRHPGIVFTVYNWARPRDLSHYERFGHFHATMYRHVEALSVTPFAARAIDRGLMGLIAALARNLEGALNPNEGAGRFDRNGKTADHIANEIKRRAELVTGDKKQASRIADQVDHRMDVWHGRRSRQTTDGVRLAYRAPYTSDDVIGLLSRPEDGRWRDTTCPTSLREVEPGIRLILDPGGLLGDPAEHPFQPYEQGDGEQEDA